MCFFISGITRALRQACCIWQQWQYWEHQQQQWGNLNSLQHMQSAQTAQQCRQYQQFRKFRQFRQLWQFCKPFFNRPTMWGRLTNKRSPRSPTT